MASTDPRSKGTLKAELMDALDEAQRAARKPDQVYVEPAELRDSGILIEINRRVLHPLGMVLEFGDRGPGSDECVIVGVQDHRNSPEGVVFGPAPSDRAEKLERYAEVEGERYGPRVATLKFWVQPMDDL